MTAIAKTTRATTARYAELLAAVLPKLIEAENERALEIVNNLMSKGEKKLTAEERWLLRLLVRLIEDFEEKAYPIDEDDMLPEYDLRQMRIVKRGPGHTSPGAAKLVRVTLDPDVALAFTDDQAVNEALRTLLRIASQQSATASHQ